MSRAVDELSRIAHFSDALPVAIWVGESPSGQCVYVNREFERILGITPPDGAARGNYVGPYGVHTPTGAPYPEDQMPYERVVRARQAVVVEDVVIHRHDGAKTYLRVFASPIFDESGEIRYVVEAFTDKTREVESERARSESERQLQAAQRLDSIGNLAAGIAHDFNNLLAIVKVVGTQLAQKETDAQRLELIGYLDQAATSATQLTSALLGFARRGVQQPRPFHVDEVVERVVPLARRTFAAGIEVRTEPGATAAIEGDASQVEQVLMNLLMNARDAMGAAGVVTVKTRRAALRAGEHAFLPAGGYVVLEVADTGPGVDPSVRDRVFEPYVTTKTAGPVKGTGLGLSMVYGIAKAHHGHAEIASTGPQGTVFRVYFVASSSAPAERRPPRAVSALRSGSGALLVVDDEPVIRRTLELSLTDLGYEVTTAGRGEDALRIAREMKDRLSAVLLDLAMPGLTGQETLRLLREQDPTLPVLIMTGSAIDREVLPLLELGAAELLPKPFDIGALSQALARTVATRAHPAP